MIPSWKTRVEKYPSGVNITKQYTKTAKTAMSSFKEFDKNFGYLRIHMISFVCNMNMDTEIKIEFIIGPYFIRNQSIYAFFKIQKILLVTD